MFLDQKAIHTLLITAVVVAVTLCVPLADREWLEEEHGLLELPTAVVLAFGAVWSGRQGMRCWPYPGGWMSATVVLLALALRELDFQKRFTPMTIETTRFYLTPTVAWQTKAAVLTLLLPVVVALLHLGRLLWRRLQRDQIIRQPWCGYLTLAALLLLTARLVEKSHVKSFYVVEETLELAFAFFLIWLVQWLVTEEGT